jgi:hypothetical protein
MICKLVILYDQLPIPSRMKVVEAPIARLYLQVLPRSLCQMTRLGTKHSVFGTRMIFAQSREQHLLG